MKAVSILTQDMSLNRALYHVGVPKSTWYYTKRNRVINTDPQVTQYVQNQGTIRPTYGTRRMAATLTHKMNRPINRKRIQRIYRKLGWIVPKKTKNEIISGGSTKLSRPVMPNDLWQADMTYIWCGVDRWCYCFNVLDVFTRQWVGYVLDTSASKDAAIDSIVHAVSHIKPKCPGLTLRTDNGTQYTSRKFRESMKTLNIQHEFIWHHTPQQNGHIESFHRTLKKEYLWPHEFANYQAAEQALSKAFVDYNNNRIHSALGYRTPNEFAVSWKYKELRT